MAVQHISIDTGRPLGRQLREGLDHFERARVMLNDIVAAMPTMVDGSDYSYLESQFGLQTGKGQTAKAELESMMGKLNANDSVSNVAASIQQVFNFFAG